MNDTFFDGLDELYHHAKFGEDRTSLHAVSIYINMVLNVVLVFCLFVTLRVRSTV